MAEEDVDPVIFQWTIKIGTAIITFMTGILIYFHKKIHEMDKSFAINEERDMMREQQLGRVETKVDGMDMKLNKALDMFSNQQLELNRTVNERNDALQLVIDQKEVIEDITKIRKIGS